MTWAMYYFGQGIYESYILKDTVDYMILGVLVATVGNVLSAAGVVILRWARSTENVSSQPWVMMRVFQVLSGFCFLVGALLAVYGLSGVIQGLYENVIQGGSDGRMSGGIMILVVAAVLSISSYVTIRNIKYFPSE